VEGRETRGRDDGITPTPLPLPGDALHAKGWRDEEEEEEV